MLSGGAVLQQGIKSGGEPAAVQTLREELAAFGKRGSVGLRWLQPRFPAQLFLDKPFHQTQSQNMKMDRLQNEPSSNC